MLLEKKSQYKGIKMDIKLNVDYEVCSCEIQDENGVNYNYTRIIDNISLIDVVKEIVRQFYDNIYLSQKQLEEFNNWDGIVEDYK